MKHYIVSIFLKTFDSADGGGRTFSHDEAFEDSNLLESRRRAIEYYNMQLQGITEKGQFYNMPFVATGAVEIGNSAAWFIDISLYHDDDFTQELSGMGDEEDMEAQEDELGTLSLLGYGGVKPLWELLN